MEYIIYEFLQSQDIILCVAGFFFILSFKWTGLFFEIDLTNKKNKR